MIHNILDNCKDIKDIAYCQSQTDPSFKTTRLFTRLTVEEVRKQLVETKDYRLVDLLLK